MADTNLLTNPRLLTLARDAARQAFAVSDAVIEQWTADHPSINVQAEISRAEVWCANNLRRRKSPAAQIRFMKAWLYRAELSAPKAGAPAVRLAYSGGRLLP